MSEVKAVITNRLTPEAMRQLEKELPKLGVPKDAHEAGVLIGVQMVLDKLRKGFVIGDA
jgi:hypothetical protein